MDVEKWGVENIIEIKYSTEIASGLEEIDAIARIINCVPK